MDTTANITPQDLYTEVPPTKIRNREEKFRTAKDHPFWVAFGNWLFSKMARARFHSIMVKGDSEYLQMRDTTKATVFYATHNNWWDGIVAYNLCRLHFKMRLRLMIEEMNRLPLFQYVGCFPVNKKSAQSAMKSLKYSVDILKDPDISFWIFPQGIIRPPFYRPETFQSGLAYIVQNAVKRYGGVNLVPVSVQYVFLREDRPEVLVEFGDVKKIYDGTFDKKEFTHQLEREFEAFNDHQRDNIGKANFEGYKYFYKQKSKWFKRIELRLKNIGMDPEYRLKGNEKV
ncbi:phospholipid/glycerol acyltransferase [Candidatus Gastranaerophilus sp. (ex Termes propinquus)]|nr:phospholipid/glycerol acyltransferase [Candidatus Gastranaerophilus sp. (ex Termes propinquus)]